MPNPLASAKNLKRGGNKLPTKAHKSAVEESKRVSRKLLKDPAYKKNLIKRLRAGTIQPGVEALLWYYAFGKPRETVETVQTVPVKIVHEYEGDRPKKNG